MLELLTKVSYKWELIGVHLGVEEYVLGSERRSDADNATKLYHIISKWIDMDGEFTPVTWSTIVHVLKVIDSKDLIPKLSIFVKSLQGISHTVLY